MTRVLVVDDEPSILRALRINLSAREYDVSTAVDGTTGLAVAKGFAEAMGGRIEAGDTPGGGLTITVTLPAAIPDKSALGAEP